MYFKIIPAALLLILSAILAPVSLWSQAPHRCGFDSHRAHLMAHDPEFAREWEQLEAQILARTQAGQAARNNCNVFLIPVVVHVVFNDALTNISDQQIASQIGILNQDFRRLPGAAGEAGGVDTRIQFALATLDPAGQPTSGITRTQSALTNHTQAEEAQLKALISWNTAKYLNIWVVRNINAPAGDEILGYATPPGGANPQFMGVVISGKYFGNTGSVQAPYNGGRTATHEVGHYLGLFHTFGTEGICDGTSSGNCLQTGDRVCDTPAERDAKYGCPAGAPNTCRDGLCDKPDAIRNYMNYVNDVCMDEFTQGQVTRMHALLGTSLASLVSPANLAATGIAATSLIETPPQADFLVENRSGCTGAAIQFTPKATGCVESYAWAFPGGSPAISTQPNPVVTYAQPGVYSATLTVFNRAGNTTKTRQNIITINDNLGGVPMAESFETGAFPPPGWLVIDHDGLGSWSKTGAAGSQGNASAVMANFTAASCNSPNDLLTPVFDLRGATGASLSFDYSYRARSVDPDDADQLMVQVSEDCGLNWNTPPLFEQAGFLLAVDFTLVSNTPYLPASADWKRVSFDLQPFAGKDKVRFRFRCFSKSGQNLFLDNFVFDSNVSVDPYAPGALRILPNPVQQFLAIEFSTPPTSAVKATLMDMQGRTVATHTWSPADAAAEKIVWQGSEIQGLAPGVYILQLVTGEGSAVAKLVKE